jgi:hypothetical protein
MKVGDMVAIKNHKVPGSLDDPIVGMIIDECIIYPDDIEDRSNEVQVFFAPHFPKRWSIMPRWITICNLRKLS